MSLGKNPDIRKKMNVDLERGIFQSDTPEEAEQVAKIVASYAEVRKAAAQAGVISALPVSKCGTTLKQAQEKYGLEKKSTLGGRSLLKHAGVLKTFIESTGNVDVAMVTTLSVTDFKQKLLASGRAATTINDQMGILKGFFEYCINNKIARMENPASGLHIPKARNKAESYEPFKIEELQAIFDPKLFINKCKLPDLYWGPLIALFTGARAEEIASLNLSQIYPAKGIYVIDILVGKTANATRRVPIHDQLIKLGFIDYVQNIKSAGYTKVFPHLQDGKNGYKKNMCRQFGEYLDLPEVNIVDPLKVFHSFRHTVVSALTNAGVNDGLKRAMVGHDIATKTSAHDVYIHASALTIPNLQLAINKLEYPELDFEALRIQADSFMPIIAKRVSQQKMKEGTKVVGKVSKAGSKVVGGKK